MTPAEFIDKCSRTVRQAARWHPGERQGFRDCLHNAAVGGCLIAALLLPGHSRSQEQPQQKEPIAQSQTAKQPAVVPDAAASWSIFDEAVKIRLGASAT
jgi:hypothetical protein